MVGELGERDARVEPTRAGHHVGGDAAEAVGLHAGGCLPVDRGAPTREPHETHRARLEPADQSLDARDALAVLIRRDLAGAHGGTFHEIGHSRSVVHERVTGVAIARHDARAERGGPESVAGPGETHARVCRVQTRVEPADQETHPGSDHVGQRARPPGEEVHPRVAGLAAVGDVDELESCTDHDVAQLLGLPAGEEAPGKVVVGVRTLALPSHHRQVRGRAHRERVVELHQRPREANARDVEVAGPRPRAAERGAPEWQRLEVPLDDCRVGRDLACKIDHRVRSVECDRGPRQVGEMQARAATEIGDDRVRLDRGAQERRRDRGTAPRGGRATPPRASRTPPRCRDPSP